MLLLVGVLVYANSLQGPLLLDDHGNIAANPGIRRLWPLSAALAPPPGPISFYTRPVLNLTMAWDYAHSGTGVAGYRRTNVTLHVLSGFMLFLLLGRLMRRRSCPSPWMDPDGFPAWLRPFFPDAAGVASFAAALLWVAHPLNTAAMNYLSQRGELLVTLFILALFYSLMRAADAAPAGRWKWQAAAVIACLLGMGSKENMLVAPLLALVFDRLFLADSWREVFRRRGLVHGLLWLTAWWPIHRQWLHSPHFLPGAVPGDARWHYALTQCWALARMLRLAFWPDPLVFYYGAGLVTDWRMVWPQALFLLAVVITSLWALFKYPRAGFAGAVFFGLLAPSSTLIPIWGQPVAEHRMYAPLAALSALAAAGLCRIGMRARRRDVSLSAFLILVLAASLGLGAMTSRRNAVYRDSLDLWLDTVRKVPGSHEAHNSAANMLAQRGRYEEAIFHYREAWRLKPESIQYLHNLAMTYLETGRFREAIPGLEKVLQEMPNDTRAILQLARALAATGRREEALERLRVAAAARPDESELKRMMAALDIPRPEKEP